jgi:hypothetical protein
MRTLASSSLAVFLAFGLPACGSSAEKGGNDGGYDAADAAPGSSSESSPETGAAPPRDCSAAAADADGGASPSTGFPELAECNSPGPFTVAPTVQSLPSQMTGAWVECAGGSIFKGADVPHDEVGVVVRADHTWYKMGAQGGQLTTLSCSFDYGTWSTYGGGISAMFLFSWDATGMAAAPTFSPDGRSVQIVTPAGGNTVTLVKVPGTP